MFSASARVTLCRVPVIQDCVFLRSHAAHWRAAPALHGTSKKRCTAATVVTAMASGSDQTKNVLGGELQCCCKDPVTGFQRDGYCRVVPGDGGVHAVCAQVSDDFLEYTKEQGNDLSTPRPGFPGLKNGSKWCLCVSRWKQAHDAGKAPKIFLEATDAKALDTVPLELLKQYAVEDVQ